MGGDNPWIFLTVSVRFWTRFEVVITEVFCTGQDSGSFGIGTVQRRSLLFQHRENGGYARDYRGSRQVVELEDYWSYKVRPQNYSGPFLE